MTVFNQTTKVVLALINSQSTTEADIRSSRETQARAFYGPQEPCTEPQTVGLEASLTATNLL